MNSPRTLPVYITDTHSLYWFRQSPIRLSPAADAVFRLAAAGEAQIIIPAIVVAELYYLTQRLGAPVSLTTLFADIDRSTEFIFSALRREQLETMEQVRGIPEMHDRLIAAEALVHQAPIVTNDQILRQSDMVQVIW